MVTNNENFITKLWIELYLEDSQNTHYFFVLFSFKLHLEPFQVLNFYLA